ncbi:MAG TPA: hypothetical protein VMH34_10585 [Gammaproteobacteria bacterium]|nr:hypothetical protein [Gammaproteobacteria bacterium]
MVVLVMPHLADAVAVSMFVLVFAAVAAEEPGAENRPVARGGTPATDPGFKALDTLAELKKISDERHAACLSSFGHQRFCNCLNGRLSLDLTFDDYIVLVTRDGNDPAYRSMPPEKQQLAAAAADARDQCMKKAFR